MGYVPWKRDNRYRRKFALVMGQKNQLWWDLPAQESFRLHQQIYQIETDQYQRTLDELTGMLELRSLLKRPVRELSLGERMKMELTAALLHQPEVLFLDEPTIGLDVVAQHNIQQFLKHYRQERGITTLLTTHYMKDVEALCERVVIIARGSIHFDGSLAEIVDRTTSHKLVTLQVADGESLDGMEQFGSVEEIDPPKVTLRLQREDVASKLSAILDHRRIVDVVVEDPPLEEVLADIFTQISNQNDDQEA
jgi:ABC-2 type transport system ATP-binding protein